ncbi:muscarinic acetylcholine receptor M4-like [Ptychodera flava]|uniref:muscarinic acetylcholine receptor M4-like n=1 Tax=Ptychodera flava TaxID=63121 RepID=UPI003969FC3B
MKFNVTSWSVHNNTLLTFRQSEIDSIWNLNRELDQNNIINGSTETPEVDGPLYGPVAFITLAVVLTTIALVTTVSNLLIIVAFMCNKKLRKLTNYFYVSLAFSDFIAGLFDMPLEVWETLMGYENWTFGKITCVTWLAIDYWIYTASTYTMLAICIDRYMAILHGLRYRRKRTHGLVMTMIVSCWLLAFVTEVPGIVFWEYWMGESILDYSYYCDVEWSENETYAMVNTLLTMLLPFVCILFLSFTIWLVLRRRARSLRGKTKTGAAGLARCVSTNTIDKAKSNDKTKNKRRLKEDKVRRESKVVVSTLFENERSHRNLETPEPRKPWLSDTPATAPSDNGCDAATQTDFTFSASKWEMDENIYCNLTATCDKSVGTEDIDDKDVAENILELCDVHVQVEGIDNPAFVNDEDVHANAIARRSKEGDSEPNMEDNFIDFQVKDREVFDEIGVEKQKYSRNDKSSGFPASKYATNVGTELSDFDYQERKRVAKHNKHDSREVCSLRLNTAKSQSLNRLAGDRRAAISFGILMATFLVLWTPWFVIAVIESVCSETCVMGDEVYYLSAWLIYLNSMINPFIYVFRDAEFKRSVRAILRGLCCCCQSNHVAT